MLEMLDCGCLQFPYLKPLADDGLWWWYAELSKAFVAHRKCTRKDAQGSVGQCVVSLCSEEVLHMQASYLFIGGDGPFGSC